MQRGIFVAIAALVSVIAGVRAQTTPLKGVVIGTELSVDYSTGAASTTVNTKANLFDNNTSTIFASHARSGTWVGLDLGRKHVITKIAYAPREGYASRLQLGIFEGANNPDFTDAVPIYMITDVPREGKITEKFTRVSRGFRYVRYVGPNDARCNISELRFYGREGEGSDTRLYMPTNLPLLVIHTAGARDITSKTEYMPGIISVITDRGAGLFTDSLEIRGRGNGSWSFPKKPCKLKLAHATYMLGMPAKAKKWTLLSNYGDKTLMRNLLAFKISELMGMEYTPAGRLVDVMYNGEYKGTYQLCDQIDVRKNRVDITEMGRGDNQYPEVGGGYLVEIDAYASQEKKWFTTTDFSLPVSLKYPDEDDITPEQYTYIQDAVNRMAGRVAADAFNHPVLGFRRYLDEDSFLRRIMIGELAANVDALWSVHMYKDRDSTRFHTGPVWDFDLAFDNDLRVHPVPTYSDKDFLFMSHATTSAGNMRGFTAKVVGVGGERMRRLWSDARHNRGLTLDTLNAFLDSLQSEVNASQKLNFIRWPILDKLVNQNYEVRHTFEAEMQALRDFLAYRLDWMDKKVGLIPVGVDAPPVAQAGLPVAVAVDGGISIVAAEGGADVTVYAADGTEVAALRGISGEKTVALGKGIYIIRSVCGGKAASRKIVVR